MILLEVNDAWGIQSAVRLYNDDDEDVLECEKSLLESSGYTVLTVAFTASVWSLTTDNNTQPRGPRHNFAARPAWELRHLASFCRLLSRCELFFPGR